MLVGVGIAEMRVLPWEREECFSTFVALQRDRARRLAWRLVGGDEAAAEDVTQDAFVKAYQALGRFRGRRVSKRGSIVSSSARRITIAAGVRCGPSGRAKKTPQTQHRKATLGCGGASPTPWTNSHVGSAKPSYLSILRDLRCRSAPIFWENRAEP